VFGRAGLSISKGPRDVLSTWSPKPAWLGFRFVARIEETTPHALGEGEETRAAPARRAR
jgi:hypothetical protein